MFNQEYAQQVYDDLISRDPDEAEMLSLFTVYDVIHDDIVGNKRTLDSSRDAILKSMREDLAPILMQRGDDESLIAAALLSVVSKSSKWEEDLHPRNKQGRFRRKLAGGTYQKQTYQGRNDKQRTRHRTVYGEPGILGHNSAFHQGVDEFSRRIDEARQDDNAASRIYGRMEAGGKVLGVVGRATSNPGLAIAGHTAQFAGMYGPQAEKIVGDSMRRNTYRFRGTERKVDNNLQKHALAIENGIAGKEGLAPNQLSPEQRAEAGRLAAIGYFVGSKSAGFKSRLPSAKNAELQIASGRIPPSEGIIIDANGDITKQSVGYMEDHYLPFNLKNMKALQGGQYVRTRSTGGPTSEDISAATLAGARSLTVVSRSGIFTIDLADDLRGGRRYNDKVKQMSGQYQSSLAAINTGKITRRKISHQEKAQIRDDVETELAGYSPDQKEAEFNRRVETYSSSPRLTDKEGAAIERRAHELAVGSMNDPKMPDDDGRPMPHDEKIRESIFRSQLTEDAMAGKSNTHHRLDGEGYEAALNALQEQFPYYIQDTKYTALRDPEAHPDAPSEKDIAFVGRGKLRPAFASTGGKVTMSHERLGGRFSGRSSESSAAEAEESTEGKQNAPEAKEKPKTPQDFMRQRSIAESMRQKGDAELKNALDQAVATGWDIDARLKAPVMQKLQKGEKLSSTERAQVRATLGVIHRDITDNAEKTGSMESDGTYLDQMMKHLKGFDSNEKNTGVGVSELKRDDTDYGTPISFEGPSYQAGHKPDVYAKQYALRAKKDERHMPADIEDADDGHLKQLSKLYAVRAGLHEKGHDQDPHGEDAFDSVFNEAQNLGDEDPGKTAANFATRFTKLSPEDHKKEAEYNWQLREATEQMRTLKKLHGDASGSSSAPEEAAESTGHLRSIESHKQPQIEPVRTKRDLLSHLMGAAKNSTTSEDDRELLHDMIHQVRHGDMAEARAMTDQITDLVLRHHVNEKHDSYFKHGEDAD